jgi:hypothetical protein
VVKLRNDVVAIERFANLEDLSDGQPGFSPGCGEQFFVEV